MEEDGLQIEFMDSDEPDGETVRVTGVSKSPMQSKRFMTVFFQSSFLTWMATFIVWCVFHRKETPEFGWFEVVLVILCVVTMGALGIQFVGGEKALNQYASVLKAGIDKAKPPARS